MKQAPLNRGALVCPLLGHRQASNLHIYIPHGSQRSYWFGALTELRHYKTLFNLSGSDKQLVNFLNSQAEHLAQVDHHRAVTLEGLRVLPRQN